MGKEVIFWMILVIEIFFAFRLIFTLVSAYNPNRQLKFIYFEKMDSASGNQTSSSCSQSPLECPDCGIKLTGQTPELPCGHCICIICAKKLEESTEQKCPVQQCRSHQTSFDERIQVSNLPVRPIIAFFIPPPPYEGKENF